jgi:hypothetical protein
MKSTALFAFLLTVTFLTNAQSSLSSRLPKVFVLGEYEKDYETLVTNNQTQLLQACNNDLFTAHNKWTSMVQEMEAYANQVNFDLKGIKLWIHVFWDKNGSISHIAYHLKPQSRNVKTEDLSAFFLSFASFYRLPHTFSNTYAHYGSASFPTAAIRIDGQ